MHLVQTEVKSVFSTILLINESAKKPNSHVNPQTILFSGSVRIRFLTKPSKESNYKRAYSYFLLIKCQNSYTN